MSKTKLTYTGTAAGQAGSVLIGGRLFKRGETYELDTELAEQLVARGGFDVVEKPKPKPATAKATEE
jgi:hypothetical protein